MTRTCGLCGQEAAGFASIWSVKLGETWLCHGDDDASEPTCYQKGQASYLSVRADDTRRSIDMVAADGDGRLVFDVRHWQGPECLTAPRWVDLFGGDPDFCDGRDVNEWLDESRGEA